MPRQLTNTERYWSDDSALLSMAAYLDYVPTLQYLADHFHNYRNHGRRLPSEIKASLINESIAAGWSAPDLAAGMEA